MCACCTTDLRKEVFLLGNLTKIRSAGEVSLVKHMNREEQPISVIKFGGASLKDGQKIQEAAEFVACYDTDASRVIVVSALKGETDHLDGLASAILRGNSTEAIAATNNFYERHWATINSLPIDNASKTSLAAKLYDMRSNLLLYPEFDFSAPQKIKIFAALRDEILSQGEEISSHIVATMLREKGIHAQQIDADTLIQTDNAYGNARPDIPATKKAVERLLLPVIDKGVIPVAPGFYGFTKSSTGYRRRTTLGRNASDYSAMLIAYALEAQKLTLHKGVDGVYDKNPMEYEDAQFLPEITYDEATHIALNGGKVIYPDTMALARERSIPIYIRNSCQPEARFTVVREQPVFDNSNHTTTP